MSIVIPVIINSRDLYPHDIVIYHYQRLLGYLCFKDALFDRMAFDQSLEQQALFSKLTLKVIDGTLCKDNLM